MTKRILSLLVALVAVVALVACGNKDNGSKKPAGKTYELAVVTDVGSLMDGGFNQGTYEGVKNYAEKNGKTYQYYQPANGADATDEDRISAMRQAVANGAKVIVCPGFLQENAIRTVATESPEVKFVFVDGWALGLDNVTAIVYKEQESGFLAGYAAVMDGFTKLGGVFGGEASNPACNRFAYGYVQGIKAASAAKEVGDIDVAISFLYGGSFSASDTLKAQVASWYAEGCEIVFSCGGSMLQSVKAAAEEATGKYIIGVDTDQSKESDLVKTSAFKGLATSVELVLGQYYAGEWDSKLKDVAQNLGAKEDATGLPTAEGSWRFENYTVEEYTAVYNQIKNGTITPDADVTGCDVATFWTNLSNDNVDVNVLLPTAD